MLKKLKIVLSTIIASLIFAGTATALEFQTDTTSGTDSNPVTLKFTFGETLNITTSGDIVITNLTPGTKGISSSNYKVSVSTNNQTGYTLSATIGCNSGTSYGTTCFDNTKLVDHNNNDTTTNNFAMVASDNTALTAGTWGISLDNTITEVGEYTAFDTLPLHSSTAKIINQTINATGTPATGYTGTNDTTVRIGAYATNSQLQGTYTNTINFIAVANTVPKAYMQDQTTESLAALLPYNGSTTTLYDKRDENDYTVAKINGQYWMTQNLRFTGTQVTSATSNVTADKTITYYDLAANGASGGECYGTTTPSGDGWNNACIKDSGDTTKGVWYNYYAATAGTVSGLSNNSTASQDICPKNWHLPSAPNTVVGTDINKLISNAMSGWQANTASFVLFNAVTGGSYDNGLLHNIGNGAWWSATPTGSQTRYYIGYNSSDDRIRGDNDFYRYYGYFVRCVRSE